MRRQSPDPVEVAVRETWRRWRRRRRGEIEDRASLRDFVRSARASAPDPVAPYVQMATSDFSGKLLRVTNEMQVAALKSVDPIAEHGSVPDISRDDNRAGRQGTTHLASPLHNRR
jgi:hypothetical protein